MTTSDGSRYEDDFYAWTQYQAGVLRSMPAPDNRFDREHVVEEIEDLGKSERDAVRSQVRHILEHLLKLAHSSAEQRRLDWIAKIIEARQTLSTSSPPRSGAMSKRFSRNYTLTGGRGQPWVSARAASLAPPNGYLGLPWSPEEICQDEWYPVAPEPP
jgi:hypothetical protein